MRSSTTELRDADCDQAGARPGAMDVPPQQVDLESLLQPFLEQSASILSIIAVGCPQILGSEEATLLRVFMDEAGRAAIIEREPIEPAGRSSYGEYADTLGGLAQMARELSGPGSGPVSGALSGNDLLLLPAHLLTEMMTPLAEDFSFRAVAALLPESYDPLIDEKGWRLRRSLFDRGLVCIGSVHVAGTKALCFLASDAVRTVRHLNVESRGDISMPTLVLGAGFANQLFRYAWVKLYALRIGMTAAFPAWDGNQLFGLADKSCEGLDLPRVTYAGFEDKERELWETDDPPVNIDLAGYFQELPECWRRHRLLLRRLFQLTPEHLKALDAWRQTVTEGGRRTLVAIHIRRGDYRTHQGMPYFRMAPEDWYLEWLRTIWPTLHEPVLYVATDEPHVIWPVFGEFEMVSAPFGSVAAVLPDHILDFEVMRRADYLAICNSSFSRMAAILAPSTQKCFLPSFQTQIFSPYEPWIDPAFWARFADSGPTCVPVKRQEPPAPAANGRNGFETPAQPATILFDVSDLLLYLLHHTTLSGIQRVQCEILRNLVDVPYPQPVRFVVLNERARLGSVETPALLKIIEDIRSGTISGRDLHSEINALLRRVVPCPVQSRDIFLTLGAFWGVKGMGTLLQRLKNSGAVIGAFIHDIIPITAPEYFEARATRIFIKGVVEALTFADFIVTTSEYNKASLIEHMAARKLDPLPVHVVPLGHDFSPAVPIHSKLSSVVSGIVATDYVLCVGTIEVRKNPTYLFNIWKMMVKSGRSNIPYLVFAGRKGWLTQDFLDQLKACDYLDGRILVVHDVTDAELELLYRKCMLTMFPSFVEGWGLPAGESLAHGKICICSAMGGIPEVGGELLDYINPYNVCDGLERLSKYLDDPELRAARSQEIVERFQPRPWQKAADDFLRSTQVLARQARPIEGVAAILLPRDRYLEISSDATAITMNGMDGTLSAELICISGWRPPEASGVRAAQPETMIRFRTEAPVGTRIKLVLRFAAHGRDFRIHIRSGSGAETEVSLTAESEKVAHLSCEVEAGNLVTAELTLVGATFDGSGVTLDGDEFSSTSYWMLKGILYFDPKRVAAGALSQLKGAHVTQVPATRPLPLLPVEKRDQPESRDRVPLSHAAMDDSRRAASFGAFLQSSDCYWPSGFTSDRDAPIFANHADRSAFYSSCGNSALFPQVGRVNDNIKLIRRRNQLVSMSTFSEGSVFDRSGAWKSFGFLQGSPAGQAPWLSNDAGGVWIDEESLKAAPHYEHSCLIFYNGNLHNYYHWLVEGLLSLDILSRALGRNSDLKVVLPKSMDINALFDHRESLRAVGLGGDDIAEVSSNLIQVREAIWVDSDDLVRFMPAPYVKDFQQRIAAMYTGLRSPRNRRLLVARKGPTRKIHNIEQVQTFLSRYDFETVYLEGMSIVDQILLFQSAEFIIGPHGAGLSNLLFCEPGTKVIELMPSVEMRPFFWFISEKLDLVHGMQFCATVPNADFQADITVDVDKLQALIRMVEAHC